MAESFLTELKRRNVFKVGVAYLVLAWVIVQVTSEAVPALHLPDWVTTFVFFIGAIGFPFALFFAWAFEITPEGIKKESDISAEDSMTAHTGRKLDFMIIGLLVVALGYFIYESRINSASKQAAATNLTGNTTSPNLVKGHDEAPKQVPEIESIPSIAVLPFINMSSDEEQEYFSDGLSEEFLNLLAKIPQLRVIARTSSFSFKDKGLDIAEIAKKLDVEHILEGSVRKSGTTLRITAQLIRTSDSSHLWSETYDRELKNIFAIQDEVALAVVKALKLKLLPNHRINSEKKTISPEAYNQYLLGHNFVTSNNTDKLLFAETAYKKAIKLEPDYALAIAELSFVTFALAERNPSLEIINKGKEKSLELANRAIFIEPELDAGYRIRSIIESYSFDFIAAEADSLKALQLGPGVSGNLISYGGVLLAQGQLDEALSVFNKASKLDPLSSYAANMLARIYNAQGKFEKAEETILRAIQITPEDGWNKYELTESYLLQGKVVKSLTALKDLDGFWKNYGVALAAFSNDDMKLADEMLNLMVEENAFHAAYQIATVYAWRGESENALLWLERSYEQKDAGLSLIKHDPLLNSLRDDEHFKSIINKMGLPL